MFRHKERGPVNPSDVAKQVVKDVFKAGQITVADLEGLMDLYAQDSLLRNRPSIPGQSNRLALASDYFGQLDPDGTILVVQNFQSAIAEELRARRSLEPTKGHTRWSLPKISLRLPHIPKVIQSEIAAVTVSAAVLAGGYYSWDLMYGLYKAPEIRIAQACEDLADGVNIPEYIEVRDPEKIRQACHNLSYESIMNRMSSDPLAYPERWTFPFYLVGMGAAPITGLWKTYSLGRRVASNPRG